MAELKATVKKDFGNLSEGKRFTLTSWNDNEAKYDIRNWTDKYIGKGITFAKEDLKSLRDLLLVALADKVPTEAKESESEASGKAQGTSEKTEPKTEKKEESKPEVKAETKVSEYPEEIAEKFARLDELFKGLSTHKAYKPMKFAPESGDRLQYLVDKADFPEYETLVEELELNSFITDKGSLFIYSV